MNILKLKQFIVLAELQNMSKAANALYISQPALSQSISTLENELGCKLFDRVNKKLVLNEHGQLALFYARDLVAKAEEMVTAIAVSVNSQQSINICSDIYVLYSMISAAYMLGNPTGSTIFVPRQGDAYADLLCSGRTDVIISIDPIEHEDVTCKRLFTSPQYILVPAESPFYGRASVSPEELRGVPFYRNKDLLTTNTIFYDNTAHPSDRLKNFAKTAGVEEHYVDFNSMRMMWNSKDHCFFVTAMTLMALPESRQLDPRRFVRVNDEQQLETYYLSIPKKRSKKITGFFNWFEQPDNEFWTRYQRSLNILMRNNLP